MIVDAVSGTVDMEVSSNVGTLNHPFCFRISILNHPAIVVPP